MQIWSALGTSDGTSGAASADNRTVGGPPTRGRGTAIDYEAISSQYRGDYATYNRDQSNKSRNTDF